MAHPYRQLRDWLFQRIRFVFSSGSRRRTHRPSAQSQPVIEALECRLLMTTGLPTPSHVVVVVEENHSHTEIIGNSSAPYINSLANGTNAALFTQSYAIEHPSQPNYLDLFSGSNQGITNNNTPGTLPFRSPNLGSELLHHGQTFATYSEDLPSVGFTGDTAGGYARKHNPMVNWQSTYGASPNGIPAASNQPFSSFPTDFNSLPTVSFVVPNLTHDMHDGTVAQGDTWLQSNIGSYAEWAKTHNSLLIVTWDEDDYSASNKIPTIFVGQSVHAGQYSETIDHYTVLRTLEDIFNLAHAGNSNNRAPITDVWEKGSLNAPTAPTGLTATSNSCQVSLSWTPTPFATSYNVYRSTAKGQETLYKTGVIGTSFIDDRVKNGVTYFYQIVAANFAGKSTRSSEISATPKIPIPDTPASFTVQATDRRVELSWSASANARSYNVYRSTSAGKETLYRIGVIGTTFIDMSVRSGTTFFYRITAVNGAIQSSKSIERSVTPTFGPKTT